jgi:NAD(P)-dependent dehydrogenase (short-subunit alcohol dehydrogenase family)
MAPTAGRNPLHMSPVDTSILTDLGISEADRPLFLETMAGLTPVGRLGEPDEPARAALFLASDAGSFVNGIELRVDGGMSLS